MKKYIACALRGRYRADGTTEQHLELNSAEYINSLTTVQKDYLVLEYKEKEDGQDTNRRY